MQEILVAYTSCKNPLAEIMFCHRYPIMKTSEIDAYKHVIVSDLLKDGWRLLGPPMRDGGCFSWWFEGERS